MAAEAPPDDRGPASEPARPWRRRLALVVGAVAIGSTIGLGIDLARVGGPDAWLAARGPSQSRSDLPPYEVRGRMIEVDGRGVYLDCRGAGSPTIILENGFGSGAAGWVPVLDEVAAFTRVCAWDRPGLGRSAGRGRHTAGEAAADLRAALAAAGEAGPWVIVAHSLGGVYARIFADTAPTEVAGAPDRVVALVLLDPYEPDLGLDTDPKLADDVRATIRRSLEDTGAMFEAGEDLDWPATLAELEHAGTITIPTTFLSIEPTNRLGDPDPVRQAAIIDAWYRAVAARYPNGRIEIVPDSGHVIHYDQPALVVDRIREAVLAVRGQ